jgi:hypothetical protein
MGAAGGVAGFPLAGAAGARQIFWISCLLFEYVPLRDRQVLSSLAMTDPLRQQ